MLDAVDGPDALQNILDGVVHRVLPCLQGKTLVPHILERDHLPADFLLGQFLSGDVLVLRVVGAVNAAVYAVVGQVKGGEHNNAVAVKVLFNLLRQGVNLLILVLQIAV